MSFLSLFQSICLRRQIASVHLCHDTDASPKKTRILWSLVLIMSTSSLKLSLAAFYLFSGLFLKIFQDLAGQLLFQRVAIAEATGNQRTSCLVQ